MALGDFIKVDVTELSVIQADLATEQITVDVNELSVIQADLTFEQITVEVVEAEDIYINVTECVSLRGNADITKCYTAAVAVGGHRVVVSDENNKIFYASHLDLTHANRVLGLSLNSANAGGGVLVMLQGEVTEPSWTWDVNLPIFLGENGLLTQTVPTSGFSIIVGTPTGTTSMMVRIESPIFLN